MKYFAERGFLQFEVIDDDQEIIRYTINDWKRHCTHLAYNYYSYKGSGFFFFPLPTGRLLLQAAKAEGRIVFSELDALMDMWLHTIVNDPSVKGSEYMPVVYYSNTRHLLRQYRKVAYAVEISETDMNVRMEMEHGTRLSTLKVNAELAGVDLSGSKIESYARTVIRSKNMLQIIENALDAVRKDPDHGELMYQILYLTYFTKKRLPNRDAILIELDRLGFPMSMVTYWNCARCLCQYGRC